MKTKCLIWPVLVALVHAVLAVNIAMYSGITCGLPAAFISQVQGAITGNKAEAEYFLGRMADLFPYVLGGECLLIVLGGAFICDRRSRKKMSATNRP